MTSQDFKNFVSNFFEGAILFIGKILIHPINVILIGMYDIWGMGKIYDGGFLYRTYTVHKIKYDSKYKGIFLSVKANYLIDSYTRLCMRIHLKKYTIYFKYENRKYDMRQYMYIDSYRRIKYLTPSEAKFVTEYFLEEDTLSFEDVVELSRL